MRAGVEGNGAAVRDLSGIPTPRPAPRHESKDLLKEIEELICTRDGVSIDLLREDQGSRTTLGIFINGQVVDRVVPGSCGWGHLHPGDTIKAVNGVQVDAHSVLTQIRRARHSLGTAISFSVERIDSDGVARMHDAVILRQRLETVSRSEALIGLLMDHGELIQSVGDLGVKIGDGKILAVSRQMQTSFESIQLQFGEMQHETCQTEHNLATHLAFVQERTQRKLKQARRIWQDAVTDVNNVTQTDEPPAASESSENSALSDKAPATIAAAPATTHAHQVALLEEKMKQMDKRLSETLELEHQLRESRQAMAALQQQQHKQNEEMLDARSKNEDLKQRHSDMLTTCKEVQQESTEIKKEYSTVQAQLAESQNALMDKIRLAEEEQARTDALKLENSTLQKSLQELQDELADFQRTSEENLAQMAKQYEQKIKDAMKSVDNQKAQAETAKLQQQLKQADHALAAAQAELEKTHAKVLEADQAHASDKKQFVLLEEKVASLEHALAAALAELEKAHTEVLEANQAHASEKTESSLLAEKMARLELMCRDIERGHTQLEVAHRSAKERLHRTEKALKRVEEELGVTQIDLAEAQEIMAQLNEDTAEKANESAKLLARFSILENEKVALCEKNSSLLAAVKGSETELEDVKRQLIQCQQDLSAKCTEEGAARAELNSCRADLQAIDNMARLIAGDSKRSEAPADITSPTPGKQQNRDGLHPQDRVGKVQQMLARHESATRTAEEMAANSAEELAACRRQLAHEGKEMELVLSEICELQQAVEAQCVELASAYERIRQLEGGSGKTSAPAEQASPSAAQALAALSCPRVPVSMPNASDLLQSEADRARAWLQFPGPSAVMVPEPATVVARPGSRAGNLSAAAKGRKNKAVIAAHREG